MVGPFRYSAQLKLTRSSMQASRSFSLSCQHTSCRECGHYSTVNLCSFFSRTRNKASLQTKAVLWGVTFVMFGASTADYALGFVYDRIFILNMLSYFLERSSNPMYPMMLFEPQAMKPLLRAQLFVPMVNVSLLSLSPDMAKAHNTH